MWAKRIDIKSFFTNSVRVHSFKLRNQEFNKECKSIFHYYSSILPANGNHCSPTIHLRIILHKRVCFKFNACALCVSNTCTTGNQREKLMFTDFRKFYFFKYIALISHFSINIDFFGRTIMILRVQKFLNINLEILEINI